MMSLETNWAKIMSTLNAPLPAGDDVGAIDSTEIMARIREAIARRRVEAGLSAEAFDALATGAPIQPSLADLQYEINRLAVSLGRNEVEMALSQARPSLIGKLAQRLRAALHEVALFYVNRHAAQQAIVNRMTLHALQITMALIERQQREIEQLKQNHRA